MPCMSCQESDLFAYICFMGKNANKHELKRYTSTLSLTVQLFASNFWKLFISRPRRTRSSTTDQIEHMYCGPSQTEIMDPSVHQCIW